LEAATSVVENMIDGLAPSGYMRYAPDGWSSFRLSGAIFAIFNCYHFFRTFCFRIFCFRFSPQGVFDRSFDVILSLLLLL
jgi:hypothetical protein